MTRTCVTLRERTAEAAVRRAADCREAGADLVEVRLDHMDRPGWGPREQEAVSSLGLGTVLTLRPEWEGGLYMGSEEERSRIFGTVLGSGADHIDIELRMEAVLRDPLISEARKRGIGVIVSYHDHGPTPDIEGILSILNRGVEASGDTVKLAFGCVCPEDPLTLILAAREASKMGVRSSVMGMGPYGHLTRIFAPEMGSEMVYTSLDDPSSGDQIDIRTLRRLRELIGVRL